MNDNEKMNLSNEFIKDPSNDILGQAKYILLLENQTYNLNMEKNKLNNDHAKIRKYYEDVLNLYNSVTGENIIVEKISLYKLQLKNYLYVKKYMSDVYGPGYAGVLFDFNKDIDLGRAREQCRKLLTDIGIILENIKTTKCLKCNKLKP